MPLCVRASLVCKFCRLPLNPQARIVQLTTKLYKILKLESELQYSNKAVVGGLENIIISWSSEARVEVVPEEHIQQVISVLKNYGPLNKYERAQSLKKIGYILDIPGLKYMPESIRIDRIHQV